MGKQTDWATQKFADQQVKVMDPAGDSYQVLRRGYSTVAVTAKQTLAKLKVMFGSMIYEDRSFDSKFGRSRADLSAFTPFDEGQAPWRNFRGPSLRSKQLQRI